MRSESGELHRQFDVSRSSAGLDRLFQVAEQVLGLALEHFGLQATRQGLHSRGGLIAPGTVYIRFRGFEVSKRERRSGLWRRTRKFGLDCFKRRLQAVVDGHQFETLNPFSGQCEGREMKGIEGSQ